MWHITIPGVPCAASDSVSAVVTAERRFVRLDQRVAVSRVSAIAPAFSSASRRYGALKRPCSQACAGASPRAVPPAAASSAVASV